MLELTVCRTVTNPNYQVYTHNVRINGHETLTPNAAIEATKVAFGNRGGKVIGNGYGYKVYPNSVRKFRVMDY